jgi:hypothetical protein
VVASEERYPNTITTPLVEEGYYRNNNMSVKGEGSSPSRKELQEELERQHALVEELTRKFGDKSSRVRIPPPEAYAGGKGKLRTFLT